MSSNADTESGFEPLERDQNHVCMNRQDLDLDKKSGKIVETSHPRSRSSCGLCDAIILRPVGFVRNESDEPCLKVRDEDIHMEDGTESIKAGVSAIRTLKSQIHFQERNTEYEKDRHHHL
jgi:hypothetical protein